GGAEGVAWGGREGAETPGRTGMLITPDRALARRITARLAVWGLGIDDLAGEPFPMTLPGAFLDLVATAAQKEFEPVALMSLLKHPLCRLGMKDGEVQSGRHALGLACFRSPYSGKGLGALDAALERARTQSGRSAAVRRLGSADGGAARDLARGLDRAFQP